jgi:hypothetical protein
VSVPDIDAMDHQRMQPRRRARRQRTYDIVGQSEWHRPLELQNAVHQPYSTESPTKIRACSWLVVPFGKNVESKDGPSCDKDDQEQERQCAYPQRASDKERVSKKVYNKKTCQVD